MTKNGSNGYLKSHKAKNHKYLVINKLRNS